ncbi:MAG: hypothetical protein A3B47_04665 [Candidatus Levybacteria bacterium RIFCSPLOWO2_01_FULL_39_24]|nr:MAG: hypothetical protein A2800_04035 [Candidatus Levybacteria bacterium RIFCSPHIGHO2_01_FULL_40_16]OGH28033.1 MAG: hypothetical protein A3E12_01490 [Candidatus Levybacteria bacterium RIFCSPHIGHO2_12_FULL_39_9]OGH46737.1 MAG: hypothetical protein A3B47_04665 [Candidatus Levybacteria bacterium RIFCSPLOWO2_01_FULL_39_24]
MVSLTEKEPIGQALSPANGKELLSSQENYRKLIESSVPTILQAQNPVTGLFPASTKERNVHPYHRHWVRDGSITAGAFWDPYFLKIFPPESKIGGKAIESAASFMKEMLDLANREPWKSAFEQESEEAKDKEGHLLGYRVLTREAPPIHFETDGRQAFWDRQNQPDCWGELLISLGSGLKQNLISLDTSRQDAVESIVGYLSRIKVTELEQSSMWEGCPVYSPAPLSSVAIVAKGLEQISSFVSAVSKKSIKRAVFNARKFAEDNYPKEHTIPFGHHSETDLATLVALGLGALDGFSLSPYFIKSNSQLGNGQWPGKKRFIGDTYYGVEGKEAIWTMGALFEAKILLEKAINLSNNGDRDTGKKFQAKGLVCLKKVIDLQNQHGYLPELLDQRGGGLTPNNNHILWNEALLVQVCARAIIAENSNPTRPN